MKRKRKTTQRTCRAEYASRRLIIKLSLVFCAVFLLLFLTVLRANYRVIVKKEAQMLRAYETNTLVSVDDKLKDMCRVSLMTMADQKTLDIICGFRDMGLYEQIKADQYLHDFYSSLITIRDDISGVYLLDREGLLFHCDPCDAAVKSFEAGEIPERLAGMETEPMRVANCSLLIEEQPFFMRFSGEYLTNPYLTNCIWMIRDISAFHPFEKVGSVILTAPVKTLREICAATLEEGMAYLLFTGEGKVVCGEDPSGILKDVDGLSPELARLVREGRSGVISWNGKRYYMSWRQSTESGLILAAGEPIAEIARESLGFFRYYLLLAGVSLALMVGLVEKEYRSQLRLREGKLKEQRLTMLYLKSQVNPHFLYNTLDTIRISAQLNQDEETADMLMQLVQFFRLSVKDKDAIVTLEHEIDLISAYLQLMEYRYPSLCSDIQVDEELLDTEIPNFVLQPLVENSLLHGLRDREYKGTVNVSVEKRGEDGLEIRVEDDGVGFTPKAREKVQRLLDLEGDLRCEERESIGIRNVQSRLKMFYPDEEGLSYIERPGAGICAVIRISCRIGEMPGDSGQE